MQYEIEAGHYRATVTELGAGLRELAFRGQPLIAGYEADRLPPAGAGQLLAREHWPEVIAMAAGDQGARAFLRARPDLVTLVECGDTGRPDDIDTPADLEHIAISRPGSPSCG